MERPGPKRSRTLLEAAARTCCSAGRSALRTWCRATYHRRNSSPRTWVEKSLAARRWPRHCRQRRFARRRHLCLSGGCLRRLRQQPELQIDGVGRSQGDGHGVGVGEPDLEEHLRRDVLPGLRPDRRRAEAVLDGDHDVVPRHRRRRHVGLGADRDRHQVGGQEPAGSEERPRHPDRRQPDRVRVGAGSEGLRHPVHAGQQRQRAVDRVQDSRSRNHRASVARACDQGKEPARHRVLAQHVVCHTCSTT